MDTESIVSMIEQSVGRKSRRQGNGFRVPCPSHQGRNHNLFVSRDHEKTWFHCHSHGCHPADICNAIGIEVSDLFFNPIEKKQPENKPVEINKEAENTLKRVTKIIQNQQYFDKYIVTDYLNNRGIVRELPNDIGYHIDGFNQEMMACIIRNKDNLIAGYHRIFLTKNEVGQIVKSGKKMIGKNTHEGAIKGCHIEVQSGTKGKLFVAEGVETAFAVAQLIDDESSYFWATISASGMENLEVPSNFYQVFICADGDEAGQRAGLKLKQRLGDKAELIFPPNYKTNPKQDWLDILNEGITV